MRDRPVRMRYPVARLEVNRIERNAAPTPDRGRTAQGAPSIQMRRTVCLRHNITPAIEFLFLRRESVSSRLNQSNGGSSFGQSKCDCNPGCARADDHEIESNLVGQPRRARVDDHFSASTASVRCAGLEVPTSVVVTSGLEAARAIASGGRRPGCPTITP